MSGKYQTKHDPNQAVNQSDLKYLGFVNYLPTQVLNITTSWYSWGKDQLPEQVKGNLIKVEHQVSEVAKPYVNFGVDLEQRLLKDVDFRLIKISEVLGGYKGDADKFAQSVSQRRHEYIRQLEEGLEKVKKENPEQAQKIQAQINELKKTPDTAKEQLEQLQKRLDESWEQALQDPRVKKSVDAVKDRIEASKKSLSEAQHKVLADQRYASIYQFVTYHSNELVFKTDLYKNLKATIQPYVDNVYPREKQQETYKQAVDNTKPTVSPPSNGAK